MLILSKLAVENTRLRRKGLVQNNSMVGKLFGNENEELQVNEEKLKEITDDILKSG